MQFLPRKSLSRRGKRNEEKHNMLVDDSFMNDYYLVLIYIGADFIHKVSKTQFDIIFR